MKIGGQPKNGGVFFFEYRTLNKEYPISKFNIHYSLLDIGYSHGADWNRQERFSVSKHVGAKLLTPLTNSN